MILAAPSVRAIAREFNTDLNLIKGSGKDGRIMKHDITDYHKAQSSPKEEPIPVQKPTI